MKWIHCSDQIQDLFGMIATRKSTVGQLVIFRQCAWSKLESTDARGFLSDTRSTSQKCIFFTDKTYSKNYISRVQRAHYPAL